MSATITANEPQELTSNVRPRDEMTQPFRVVLHRSRMSNDWVTHCENVEEDGKGGYRSKQPSPDYYWGHYYYPNDYAGALKDYHERCAKYGL